MNKRNLMKGKKSEMKYALKKDGNGSSGITLIALVITIIVLLILAGVVIATLSGENGILRRAGEASDNTKRQSFIEQAQLAVLNKEVQANGKTLTNADIKEALEQYFTIQSDLDLTKTENKDVELTPNAANGYGPFASAITVKDVLGNIRTAGGGGETPGVSSQPTTSDYGDYVQYGSSSNSGLDLNGDGNYTNDWRIFYANGSGTFIIATTMVPTNNTCLQQAISATDLKTNGNIGLNWGTDLTYSTIDNSSNIFLNEHTNTECHNGKAVASLLNTNAWNKFLTSDLETNGGLAIGGPTINMYAASWSTKQYEGGDTNQQWTSEDYSYGYTITIGNTSNHTNMSFIREANPGTTDTLYLPYPDQDDVAYWLASPSAYSTNAGGSYFYLHLYEVHANAGTMNVSSQRLDSSSIRNSTCCFYTC